MGSSNIPQLPTSTSLNLADLFEQFNQTATNSQGGTGQNQGLSVAQLIAFLSQQGLGFKSSQITLDNTTLVYKAAHGLSYVPQHLDGAFACIANDAGSGFVAGQVIDYMSFVYQQPASFFADSTYIYMSVINAFVGHESDYTVNKAGGASSQGNPSSFNNFKLVLLAF